MGPVRPRFRRLPTFAVVLCLLVWLPLSCGSDDAEPFTIAYLGDFSGDLGEFGPQIRQGVELAVEHVNAGGGVNGQPVTLVVADGGSEPTSAVREARRLVEDDGVDAIVGPLATELALAVGAQVSRELHIPTITPSATSPALSDLDDGGYVFRTTLSDAAQGPILAQLVAADLELDSVAVLFEESAYGRGLYEAFLRSFAGAAMGTAYEEGQRSYEVELRAVAREGVRTLIAIGYPTEAEVYIREAAELDLFDAFVFVDGTRSIELIRMLGADLLEGSKGTAPTMGPATEATRAFDAAFLDRFGMLPSTPYVREAYDATIVLALAAQLAGTTDGPALAEAVVEVANPGGKAVMPGVPSLEEGLASARDGIDLDYRGAASAVDFDEHGDLATGYIGIWAYQAGAVVELETIPFDLR